MPPKVPEQVVFEFADHELEGRVVDTTTRAAYNHNVETILTVEADGSRYSVSDRHATPA
jgi:hypothetical protein